MKWTLIAFGLFFATSLYADLEHKEGQGSVPSSKELSISRGCFREIEILGCGHPVDDQGYFNTCLIESRATLSSTCRTFFDGLYGKKDP